MAKERIGNATRLRKGRCGSLIMVHSGLLLLVGKDACVSAVGPAELVVECSAFHGHCRLIAMMRVAMKTTMTIIHLMVLVSVFISVLISSSFAF